MDGKRVLGGRATLSGPAGTPSGSTRTLWGLQRASLWLGTGDWPEVRHSFSSGIRRASVPFSVGG
jgi:hypothetical protein